LGWSDGIGLELGSMLPKVPKFKFKSEILHFFFLFKILLDYLKKKYISKGKASF
jgi:hypothetical protein